MNPQPRTTWARDPRAAVTRAWLIAVPSLVSCRANDISVLECALQSDCAAGFWCSDDHTCETSVALVSDADGRVDASSNFLGISGAWRASADGYGTQGQRGGPCQSVGHPDSACSVLSTPDPALGSFPNESGSLCTSGSLMGVLPRDGAPDFSAMWGSEVVFEFFSAEGAGERGLLDAPARGVRAIAFDIDSVPPSGIRVELVTPGSQESTFGPPYWGAGFAYSNSPIVAGTNVVPLDLVRAPGTTEPVDAARIESIRFHLPSKPDTSSAFEYCISNLSLLSDGDERSVVDDPGTTPPPFVVDDFEDLDVNPYDLRLAVWQYYRFPSEDPPVSVRRWVDSAAALNSNGGMNLEWAIQDVPDGIHDPGGGGLRTLVNNAQVFLDLSSYTRVVLAHRHEPSVDDRVPDLGEDCISPVHFLISFSCAERGTSFMVYIPVSSGYTTSVLPFSSFFESWNVNTGTSVTDCLSRFDGLDFQVHPQIEDGQCGIGHLSIDSISIR